MKNSRIVIPDGMLKAAMESSMETTGQTYGWFEAMCAQVVEAALQWLSEHPIMPTTEQVDGLYNGAQGSHGQAIRESISEWQRRMFLAPELKLLESIQDLLWEDRATNAAMHNAAILEAYKRGQEPK